MLISLPLSISGHAILNVATHKSLYTDLFACIFCKIRKNCRDKTMVIF